MEKPRIEDKIALFIEEKDGYVMTDRCKDSLADFINSYTEGLVPEKSIQSDEWALGWNACVKSISSKLEEGRK